MPSGLTCSLEPVTSLKYEQTSSNSFCLGTTRPVENLFSAALYGRNYGQDIDSPVVNN